MEWKEVVLFMLLILEQWRFMTGVAVSIAFGTDNLNVNAIAMATTLTGALAYCVPASFASIAVLYGEEYSHGNIIFKYGLIAIVITTLVVSFVGYPIALLLQ